MYRRPANWAEGAPLFGDVTDVAMQGLSWELEYQNKPAAFLDVVRRHYDQFGTAPFEWTDPGDSIARMVMYQAAPTFGWTSGRWGTASVILEEALAH